MHVLLTRPIEQARVSRDRLQAHGHRVDLAPMLEVSYLEPPPIDPGGFDALAVTSANGVDGLVRHPAFAGLSALPLYAVGDRTAVLARNSGWHTVDSAGGGVGELAALLAARLGGPGRRVLYATGPDRAGDLEGRLAAAGIAVEVKEVYRARAVERLPDPVAAALARGAYDAVLIYSARSARAFVAACAGHDLAVGGLTVGALSEAVAAPLRAAGFTRVRVAAAPRETELFRELGLVPAR